MAATLDTMLQLLDDYQQQRPHDSSIQVVRSLRAYTRPSSASKFWNMVAGDHPNFMRGALDNQTVVLMGQSIDLIHLMAALSAQTWSSNLKSNVKGSVLWLKYKVKTGQSYDSCEYTAAIADTAQAIEIYLKKYGSETYQSESLHRLLTKFASERHYASDLVAFAVGRLLSENSALSIRNAILEASWFNYSDTVRRYLVEIFEAKVSPKGYVANGVQLRQRIREQIRAYLSIKRDVMEGRVLNSDYRYRIRPALIDHASDYFIQYLQKSLVYHHRIPGD